MQPSDVTLVQGAAHNPNEPRHFMRIKPLRRQIRVYRGDRLLAESTTALRVLEVGRDVYDPVYYLPRADVRTPLEPLELSTHCPIKGDAAYFALPGEGDEPTVEKIAWSYQTPIPMAEALKGHVAFYPEHVRFEDAPL